MTGTPVSDYKVLSLCSRWINDETQVRVKVREIGNRRKIMVDLLVLRPENGKEVTVQQLVHVANEAARAQMVMSTDHSWIRDFSTDRKTERLDGTKVLTHIRDITLAYQGY